MEYLVLCDIFSVELLGGGAARQQVTTALMRHYMQDAATDLGVLNQAAVLGLHEGKRAKVEDEGGGDAPPSPSCLLPASHQKRHPFHTGGF